MEEKQKIIEEQLSIAPTEIKNYLASGSWEVFASQISQKNAFSEEQKEALNTEIITILLGLDLVQNFKTNIQNSLGLTEFLAQQTDTEVREKIFSEILAFLPTEIIDDGETINQNPSNLDILSKQEEVPSQNKAPLPNPAPFQEDKSATIQPEERKWWEQPKSTGVSGEYSISNLKKDTQEEVPIPIKKAPETPRVEKPTASNLPEIQPEMEVSIPPINSPSVPTPSQETTPVAMEGRLTEPSKIIGLASEPAQPIPPNAPIAPQSQSPSFFEKIVPSSSPTATPQNTPSSAVDQTLSNLAEDEEEWRKRKDAFANQASGDRILKTQYPSGQDPYREPLS